MLNLNDLYLFVQAAECGGFTAAARRLGVPKSTVSKRVAVLEEELGVRLIHRTSRSFVLTDLGRDFLDYARSSVDAAENAEGIVRRHLAEPSGRVRLTTSVPTAQLYLAEHLPELAQTYPKLDLVVHVTDRFVDLVHEGFDLALRSHFGLLADSGLLQRRLTQEDIIVVGAPTYLRRRGVPELPEDLAEHDALLTAAQATTWHLKDGAGREVDVIPRERMVADESVVLLKSAVAGLGVTCLPAAFCSSAITSGELVRILPDWTAGSVTTTLLMPHRRGQLPAVRAIVDFLAERLARRAG